MQQTVSYQQTILFYCKWLFYRIANRSMSQSRSRCTVERDIRVVTSHVHPGQPCQPCILCKRANQSKYFHPKSWKDASLFERLKQFEPSLNIEPHSCICRPCRNEVKDITNKQFVPRWRKTNEGRHHHALYLNVHIVPKRLLNLQIDQQFCNFLQVK